MRKQGTDSPVSHSILQLPEQGNSKRNTGKQETER